MPKFTTKERPFFAESRVSGISARMTTLNLKVRCLPGCKLLGIEMRRFDRSIGHAAKALRNRGG
jgi:hypothetical protein